MFFCQIEALETAMYLREAAVHDEGTRFDEQLAEMGEQHNPGLFRWRSRWPPVAPRSGDESTSDGLSRGRCRGEQR